MEQLSQAESFSSLSRQLKHVERELPRSRPDQPFGRLDHLHPSVRQALDEFLFQPALEIQKRPSHSFRSHLVKVGFTLAGAEACTSRDQRNIEICAESIEHLHLGSLIVDDIQDGSEVRRNGKALHCMVGTAQALGVGNWLYFYAMRILRDLDLDDAQRALLYERYLGTVELAHYGQIMDLCIKIDRIPYAQMEILTQECLRYKTGSIVMLAMVLGALVAGADAHRIQAVEQLGYALGIYLQRMNDLGNCFGTFDSEKKWEDLIQWKPSFIWGFVAREYGAASVKQLMEAVRELPDAQAWNRWLSSYHLGEDARAAAEQDLDAALEEFSDATHMSWSDLRPLVQLKERIQKAYG